MPSPAIVRVNVYSGPSIVRVVSAGPQGPAPTVPKYALQPYAPAAGVLQIPFNVASTILVNLDQDVTTVNFTGLPTASFAQRLVVYFKQNGVGGHTVAWPNNVLWPAGGVPNLTQDPNAIDCFVFDTIDGGTTILGALAAADFR